MEWLVVLSCINNSGCAESRDAYLHYNPPVQEMAEMWRRRVSEKVGSRAVRLGTPLIATFTAKALIIPIGATYVKTNFNTTNVNVNFSF